MFSDPPRLRRAAPRRRAAGIAVFAALTAACAAFPSAAYAVAGDGLAASTLSALARITVAAPATTGAVACSGVLVAPRLVLTAEACFATGSGTDPQPATAWPVSVSFTSGGTTQTIIAAGVRYDHTRGLALAALAKTPTGITPVTLGRTALAGGNTVRVAGFGRTGSDWISDTPHEVVLTVGSVSGGTATVTGDGTLCPGDAGAPVLRDVSGGVELVGIATGGGRDGCIGIDSTTSGGSTAITTDLSSLFGSDPLGRSVLTPSDNGNAAVGAAAFGSVVATGDFDKNGYSDVVVAAPTDQPGGAASGSVTVYYASATGLSTGRRLRQTDVGAADEAGDAMGASLAVGDFNKDGYTDLAIGLPTEALGTVKAGMIMLYSGSATGLTSPVAKTQTNIGSFANEEGDLFGAALAAGDFNGDGYTDLAIGAPGEQMANETAHSGAIFVLKGSSAGLVYGWSLEQSLFGGANEEGDRFGAALAAGNVTGSSYVDLVIGAPGEAPGSDPASGAIYVMPGDSDGTGTGFGATQTGNGGVNEAGDEFGAALAVADLDKDGYADVIVGSPGESPGTDPKSGTATVLPGASSGLGAGVGLSEGHFGDARLAGDRFASSLAVGDIDGDGRADVLVGAPGRTNNGAAKAGVVYVYKGQARSSTVTSPFVAAGKIEQSDAFGVDEAGDAFGTGLGLGDVDKNGKADAIIGVPGEAVPGEPAAGVAPVLTSVAAIATGTPPAPAAASPGAGPAITEDYSYPDAAAILADQNVELISGDGHILLVPCSTAVTGTVGLLKVYTTEEDIGADGIGRVCFKITSSVGVLNLEVPGVYEIRGDGLTTGAGHEVTADLTTDAGDDLSVDVDSDGSTQVGLGASPDNEPTTLLRLTVTG